MCKGRVARSRSRASRKQRKKDRKSLYLRLQPVTKEIIEDRVKEAIAISGKQLLRKSGKTTILYLFKCFI
jgi:hypothetical protein